MLVRYNARENGRDDRGGLGRRARRNGCAGDRRFGPNYNPAVFAPTADGFRPLGEQSSHAGSYAGSHTGSHGGSPEDPTLTTDPASANPTPIDYT